MLATIITAVVAMVIGVGGAALVFWAGNAFAERLPEPWDSRVKPYVFVTPAIFVVGVFLVYPLFSTVLSSLSSDQVEQLQAGDTVPSNISTLSSILAVIAGFVAASVVVGVVRGRATKKVAPASTTGSAEPGGGTALATSEGPDGNTAGPSSWALAAIGTVAFIVVAGLAYALLSTFIGVPGLGDRVREFVGFENYADVLTDAQTRSALINNLLWVIFVPTFSVIIGLIVAVLADRLGSKAESLAKGLIFLPMAISFIGAAAIFTLIYDWSPEGQPQTGLLNAIWTTVGGSPIEFLRTELLNDFALMAIMVWLQSGFAMVLLSAAIKNVPEDTIEAARIDGATELQIFFRVVVPQIFSTIVVVATTILILVLKVFDIVRALTQGRDGTDVVANTFYDKFSLGQYGSAGVLVVVLVVLTIPFMILNIKRFREQEAQR